MSNGKKTSEKVSSTPAQTNYFFTIINAKPSDFWWNFVYFAILTAAISFIVVNNSLSALTSTTGLIILAILAALDVYPVFYIARALLQFFKRVLQH